MGFFCKHFGGLCDKPGSGFRVAVEDHVLNRLAQSRLYVVVYLQHLRIDDGHVQAGLYRVIKEDRMHRLADAVVAPECEGKVGYSAGGQGAGEIGLDPPHRLDEIHAETGVFLDSRADGKDVRVEDYVLRRNPGSGQEAVAALADFDLAVQRDRLSFLVEGHHDHRSA